MAIQLVNIGQIANDGTGDDLREAMIKINQNFEELDLRESEKTTASNLGDIGEGLFVNLLNYDLRFKKIAGGDNITLSADDEKIVINASDVLTDITVNADIGSIVLETSSSITIAGGTNISTDIENGILTINNTYIAELSEDVTPQLGGDLDAQGFDIINANTVTSNFIGSVFADDASLLIDAVNKSAFIGNLSIVGNIIDSVVGETEIRSPTNLVLAPTNNIWISAGTKLIFEGTVPDEFEAKLQATVVTADRDIILPDEDGTLATREWVNLQQFDTDIKGSVFGDDSTLLVDGVNSKIPATVIDGTLTNNLVGNVTGNVIGNTNGTHTGNVIGDVTGLINGVDPSVAAYYFNNIDLGNVGTINNIIDLIISSTEISFGTFTNPAPFNVDLGSF